VRAGAEHSAATTRPAFFARLGLDGLGVADPLLGHESQPKAVTDLFSFL
jgi:hypothetical protein